MPRTIIRGGTIANAEDVLKADLILEGEKIVGIISQADADPGDTVIDATGLLVLPGVVDAHTHIQLDTGIYKTADNWEVGTKAAAAGGVTTVIDFATQFPGQTVDQALENRFKDAQPALIDYALHCMIIDLPYGKEEAILGRLIECGVPSFKVYTTYRPNYYMDDATLMRLMQATREVDGLVVVHAENDSLVSAATEYLIDQGRSGWSNHAKGRPALAEQEAIHRVMFLSWATNAPIYVVHCTTSESVRMVKAAAEAGHPAWCETCPQYLLLDESAYDGATPERYILQPPLREEGEPEQMWNLVADGAISVISTDSCDYTLAQKQEFKEFNRTPGGLPGVETLLPLIYTYGVDVGRIQITDMVRMLSDHPAQLFGIASRKGSLRPGKDADVVLYDPEPKGTISHENLHYLAGYSPFEGMHVKGKVRMTLSRGEIVYRDGEFPAKAGRGQFIPGTHFSPGVMDL